VRRHLWKARVSVEGADTSSYIGHGDSVGCPFAKYTFPLLDGVFTPKLLLPYINIGQQQRA
jgi:hypothetical protein